MMDLDINNIIKYLEANINLSCMIVHFIRMLKSENPENSAQNFFGNIVPRN